MPTICEDKYFYCIVLPCKSLNMQIEQYSDISQKKVKSDFDRKRKRQVLQLDMTYSIPIKL